MPNLFGVMAKSEPSESPFGRWLSSNQTGSGAGGGGGGNGGTNAVGIRIELPLNLV